MNVIAVSLSLWPVARTMCAHDVRERRLEGARMWKRGMANDMAYHIYGKRCQRAVIWGVRS